MNQQKRTVLLMSALFLLVVYYIGKPIISPPDTPPIKRIQLDGNNEIREIRVVKQAENLVIVEVDYFYNGAKLPHPYIRVWFENGAVHKTRPGFEKAPVYSSKKAEVGSNTLRFEMDRNYSGTARITPAIKAGMFHSNINVSEKSLSHQIAWGLYDRYMPDGLDESTIDKVFETAIKLIDSGRNSSLKEARRLLDRILLFDSKYVSAYTEMARYHLKVSWNEKGMIEAEKLLNIALNIDSGHINSMVLLGHVYANQGHYTEAEEVFVKVSAIGTENLWLHSNWGQMEFLQNNALGAIEHYKKVVFAKRPHNNYDRAKKYAYRELRKIYQKNSDFIAIDQLYETQRKDFPEDPCILVMHAEHKIHYHEQYQEAADLAKMGINGKCSYAEYSRKVLASAYLLRWVNAKDDVPDIEKKQWLVSSQVLFSNIPVMYAYLASNENTSLSIPKLHEKGFAINSTDGSHMTGLAYAIRNKESEAVRRLLSYGADVNMPIGLEKLSPLMLGIVTGDLNIIRQLLVAGADVNTATDNGLTALDLATELGFKEVIDFINNANADTI